MPCRSLSGHHAAGLPIADQPCKTVGNPPALTISRIREVHQVGEGVLAASDSIKVFPMSNKVEKDHKSNQQRPVVALRKLTRNRSDHSFRKG